MSDKKKILVVDDEADAREFVKVILEQKDYEVILGENGREAVEKAESEKPDLIILDVMMPELDGFGACEKIKTSDDLKSIPVILLTAVEDHMKSTKYPVDGVMRAKADEYIPKPVQPDNLTEAVEGLLK